MKYRSVGDGLKTPRRPHPRSEGMFAAECQVALEEFRRRLRAARLDSKVSQRHLASVIGVSGRHIGHIEAGDRNPSFEEVVAIDSFFRRRRGQPIIDIVWINENKCSNRLEASAEPLRDA